MFCPNCGSSCPEGSAFCRKCGHRLTPTGPREAPVPPEVPAAEKPAPKKRGGGSRWLAGGLAGLCLALCAALAWVLLWGPGTGQAVPPPGSASGSGAQSGASGAQSGVSSQGETPPAGSGEGWEDPFLSYGPEAMLVQ